LQRSDFAIAAEPSIQYATLMAKPETTNRRTQFQFSVADVAPAKTRLGTETLAEALDRVICTRLVVCPAARTDVVQRADFHPLIAAAALAFKQHYPLVLSPDVLWITILQGVAQHINNHSNELRSRLVRHQTKIELVVDTELPGLPVNDAQMLSVVSAFKKRISRHLSAGKRFLLEAEFSTTDDVARIASCVALMDGVQTYFEFVFRCICGIPAVILEGSTEDWELLKKKVEALHESDLNLSWWTEKLLPLLDHFGRASRGDVDRRHWRNLCKVIERYGDEDLNGWLLKFIPYIRSGKNQPVTIRNHVLKQEDAEALKVNDRSGFTGCRSNMLPNGLSKCPVTCVAKRSGAYQGFELVSGLVGVVQRAESLALQPILGWAIAEPPQIERLLGQLRSAHVVRPPSGSDARMITFQFAGEIPADLARFYAETDGAEVDSPALGFRVDILPLKSIQPICHDSERESDRPTRKKRTTPAEMERLNFPWTHGALLRIANGDDGSAIVYGKISRDFLGEGQDSEDDAMRVFRWNGIKEPSAFVPLAQTFADWLESILKTDR
jgi:hypothetical protein